MAFFSAGIGGGGDWVVGSTGRPGAEWVHSTVWFGAWSCRTMELLSAVVFLS